MKESIVLVVLFSFLFACTSTSNEEQDYELQLVDSLSFSTGFSFLDRPSGQFYNHDQKEWCYYFGNTHTDKVIKVFGEHGEFLQEVPLDALSNKLSSIEDVEIYSSLDTIIVLAKEYGQLFFLNAEGRIWKELDLAALIPKDTASYFILYSSYFSKLQSSRNDLILTISEGLKNSVESSGSAEELFAINNWKKPQFVRYNYIYSDSIKLQRGFPMYQAIDSKDSLFYNGEIKTFLVQDEAVYAHSRYSNIIFKLDIESLTLQESFEIESDLVNTRASRVSVKRKQQDKLKKEVIESSNTYSDIIRHFYNEHLQHHYLVTTPLYHGKSDEEGTWILLIYDSGFQKIRELQFNTSQYYPYIMQSERGMYVQCYAEIMNYKTQKLSFHEFTY